MVLTSVSEGTTPDARGRGVGDEMKRKGVRVHGKSKPIRRKRLHSSFPDDLKVRVYTSQIATHQPPLFNACGFKGSIAHCTHTFPPHAAHTTGGGGGAARGGANWQIALQDRKIAISKHADGASAKRSKGSEKENRFSFTPNRHLVFPPLCHRARE